MANRPILIVCSALLLLPLTATAPLAQVRQRDLDIASRIDSLVRREADARLLSGVVLVARGDHILLQRGYGFADWERRVPNTPAMRFGIGSITKDMTERILASLADEGRLDLDAPVTKYLGEFPKGPRGGVVTVRHLLEHTSGVPWRVTTKRDETETLHPADIVDRVRRTGLLFEPGAKELYSSAGFSCLARVIEVIEGRPFDVVLRERVFRPASMKSATDETGQQLMPRRALPYRLGAAADTLAVKSAPYKDLSFLAGAGSVYATAEDVLHFVRALKSGVFGAAGQRQMVADSGATWVGSYGFINGYEASVDHHPSKDLTVVFLSNLYSEANWQVRRQVRNILLGHDVIAIHRPPPVAARFEPPDFLVGPYGDADDPIMVVLEDGHLTRDGNELYPITDRRYYVPGTGAVTWFSRNAAGAVDTMRTIWGSGQRTTAARRPGRG